MKVALLSTYIENYVLPASFKIRFLTAQKISERGHDVVFVSPSRDSWRVAIHKINDRFKVVASPGLFPVRLRVGGFSFLDALYKSIIILKSDIDVIQVTNGHRPAQLIPCLIGKYFKGAVIVDECWELLGKGGYADKRKGIIGKIISLYDRLFELRFKRIYDHIVTITKVLKNRFENMDNVTVIQGGTEVNTLRNYELHKARRMLNLPDDIFLIGMSNIDSSDHEDNKVFFEAFEIIYKEYPFLFVMMTGQDANYINRIKKEYSFSERIVFPGWVGFEAYNMYLSACNLFILPYKNTKINAARWPNRIGDYMCLERPIITNPTGDVKAFFERYKLGLLCEPTPEGFYYMLKQILDDKLDLDSIAKDSFYVANQLLSFDKRVDKLLQIFQKEINRRSG